MYEHEIPNIFQSSDIVYYYCDINTAVEHILHEKQLRLSTRKKSNDPIENMKPWFSFSGSTSEEPYEVLNRAKFKIGNAKQLCFCMNDEHKKQPNSNPKYPYEYYGFLKPRMWDQYGNKYKGICLAFSLNALKENASIFRNQKIEYITYGNLRLLHKSIDNDRIRELGIEQYWQEYDTRIESNMFYKHKDYDGENEYRFISFSDNEYDYINIENSLRGIIISDSISDFMKESINKFTNQFEVEIQMLTIIWDNIQLTLRSKKESDETLAYIRSILTSSSQ